MTKPLSCFLHSRTVSQICLCICIPASIKAAPRLPSKSRILGTFEHIRTPLLSPLTSCQAPTEIPTFPQKAMPCPPPKTLLGSRNHPSVLSPPPYLQVPVSESGAVMRKISGPGFFRVLLPSFFFCGRGKGFFLFSKVSRDKRIKILFYSLVQEGFRSIFPPSYFAFFETSKKTDG